MKKRLILCLLCLLIVASGAIMFTGCGDDASNSIEVIVPNDFKTEYIQGESYDFDRIVVKINGEIVTDGYSIEKISEKKIRDDIRYSEQVYSVKVDGVYVGKKIRIKEYEQILNLKIYLEKSAKTEYFIDEEIKYDGWYLQLNYYDGYGLLPFSEDMIVNDIDTGTDGQKPITVTYRGVTTERAATILVRKHTPNDPEIVIASYGTTDLHLVPEEGVSYSLDGENWQKSPDFTGLEVGTQYTIYARVLEDRTTNSSRLVKKTFTTEKYEVDPPVITAYDITSDSFKVPKEDGVEVWGDNAMISDGGEYWLFNNLQANTQYAVYGKVLGTVTSYESSVTEISVTTHKIKDEIVAETVQYSDYTKTPKLPAFYMQSGVSFASSKFDITYSQNGTKVDSAVDAGEYDVTIKFSDPKYDVETKNIKLIINKRAITVTADNKNAVYGEVEKVLTYSITSENQLVVGDKLSGRIVRSSGIAAGNYPITIGTLYNKNYDITFENGIYSISKKNLEITIDNKSKVYGENDGVLTYTADGLIGDDKLTANLSRAAGEDVGTYTITGTFVNNNYNISVEDGIFTINVSDKFTVTAENETIVYDGQPHGITAFTSATADIEYRYNGKAGEPVNAGIYEVTITVKGNGNYTGTKVKNCILTINKKDLTVTADNKSKSYSEDNPEFTYTMAGNIAGDTFGTAEFFTTATKFSNAGEYQISVSGLINGNYEISFVDGTLTIGKKAVTITAQNKEKNYGDADPELTYTVDGASASVLTGALSRTAGEDAGEYSITIGTIQSTNYEITFNGALFVINKASLTVKINNAEREIGEDNPEFTSVLTGLKFDDEIGIVYSCEADADSPVGTYEITATADDDNYNITIIPGTLTVNKLTNFTVEVSSETVTYDGNTHGITAVSSATVTFAYFYNNSEDEPVSAGIYEVKIVATGTGDYEGEKTIYRTLTILPRSITVTAENKTSVYGEEEAALTYSYDTDLLGNVFTGDITRESGRNAGVYSIVIGSLTLPNHEITFVNGKYTITKRAVTVAADDKAKIYGNNNPEFTYTVSGGTLAYDDVLGLCTFDVAADRTSGVGNYDITPSSIAAGNYDITYVKGILTVNPREITLSAGDNEFTYTGTKVSPNVSLLNIANDDDVTVLFDKEAVNAGNYTFTASISDANYSLVGETSFGVVINKAEQKISVDTTTFPYTASSHSITATLTQGDGEISYENNSNTNVGEYTVTVNVSGTENYLEYSEDVEITIVKISLTLEDVALSDITYGNRLSVSVVSGKAKLITLEVEGTFSITNGDEILHAGTHSVEVVFTPDDNNIDPKSVTVEITVLRKTAEINIEDGGKGIGNVDPVIRYSVSGVLAGDTYNPVVSRAPGEAVGEYGYSVADDGTGDYAPQIVSSTKFYILDKLVEFSGYSSEFIYRVGVTNGYSMQLSFKTGYDISKLDVVFITEAGTAGGSFNKEVVTFSGSGKVKLGLKIDDTFNVIFDEKVFEVVASAVNATSFSQIKSNVDTCLHSDVTLTGELSIGAGVTLHGNGHTINGTAWLPNSNYLSLVTLYGTIDNVKILGPYAYDGYNDTSAGETDYYRTTQVIYMYGSSKILNSHIEGGRYAVRIGNIGNALIENSTLKNGTQTIFIKPSNGGTNEVLTLRNVDIVQKPEGDHYPGLGIYFESTPCKDFTLKLEGNVNFYCMYTQDAIKKMPSTYQSILTTMWNDSSLSNIKHSIDGTTYLDAAIVHLMCDNNQFNLVIDENCNCYNKLTRVEKSVTVLGASCQGAGYTFDKNKVTTNEMRALLTEPASKVNHTYSPVLVKAEGTYSAELKSQVETGRYYSLDITGNKFVKYGEEMTFEISSIEQLTSAFGNYELTENGGRFYLGQYLVTYKVYDVYDDYYLYFTTKIVITDNSPAPIIVFSYNSGKGSGSKDDPYLWIGKKVYNSINFLDPDFNRNLDLFFGVNAFDCNGNIIPRENFTITISGTTFSNTTEAVFTYESNNEENTVYAVTYKAADTQGKTTTVIRYIKMNEYNTKPDNGTAPSVTRSVAGYGTLHDVNIGQISISKAGVMVVSDGKNTYSFTASGASSYEFNETGAVVAKA